MSENNAFEYVPKLTLDPAAAAVQEAPKAEEKKEEAVSERPELEKLSPAEQAAVREFAKQIDVTNTNQVLAYGAAAQTNISEFSGTALGNVRSKDLGEVGGRGYIGQGNYQQGASAEFADLRCYLMAKALEDPYMTEAEYYAHMDEFLEAYYGDAAPYVRKFIDLITDMSNAKNSCFDIYSSPEIMYGDHAFEPYNEILLEWWDNAEAAVADDPVILQHVRRSRLCCDYLRIGAIHHQAYDVRDAMRQTVTDFHAELLELGVKRISEGATIPERVAKDTNPRNWWSVHNYKD